MCRLYGFHASAPTRVECTLLRAQNALVAQSRADERGLANADGWGIVFYDGGFPHARKREMAAFEDPTFVETASGVSAATVVAHVRRATVGGVSYFNTHPFTYGRWTFAHNGTLSGFRRLEPQLRREVVPRLLAARLGSTDSELIFLWLLSRLAKAGCDPDGDDRCDVDSVTTELIRGLRLLAARSEARAAEPARLNVVLTDGDVLLASRWRNSLRWLERRGVYDCEVCGQPHVAAEHRDGYRAVVVASEPISDEPWQVVPEGSVLAVGADLRGHIRPLAD